MCRCWKWPLALSKISLHVASFEWNSMLSQTGVPSCKSGGWGTVGSAQVVILTAAPKAQLQFEPRTAIKRLSLVATELDVIGLNFDLPAALARVKVRQFGGQRRGSHSIVGTGSYRAGFP